MIACIRQQYIRTIASALGVAVFSVVLAGLSSGFGPASVQSTVSHYFVLVVLVIGLGVFTGNTGILSFGHVSFVAIAAYATALMTLAPALKKTLLPDLPPFLAQLQLDFWVSLPLSVAVTVAIGWFCGLFMSRLSGAAAAISTLGLLIITHSVLIGASDFTRGSQALYGISKEIGVWLGALFAVVAYVTGRAFKESRAGLIVRATREDEPAARAIGINVKRSRLIAWTVSVALMALGGILYAHHIAVFSPKEFHFHLTFAILVMLIVGGMTSVSGAVVGTTLVVGLIEILRRLEEGGTWFGVELPQMFGLTDIGLSVAVLIALYRRGTGVMGHREFDEVFRQPAAEFGDNRLAYAAFKARSATEGRQLRTDGVSKHFGGVVALNNVSITVEKGEIVGLIGPNGSGKSTLLACISGAQAVTVGRVILGDIDLTELPPEAAARAGIGRTFQNIRLFGQLSVLENVEAAVLSIHPKASRSHARGMALTLVGRLGLEGLSNRLAATLSYGDQRRLEIARALALSPEFLLLDEPAAGMNETESAGLIELISELRRKDGIGVVIVDHDLHMILRLCERIVVLNKGEVIAEGTPAEIRIHPEVIRAYIGADPVDNSAHNDQNKTGAIGD